ncbi:hypothetical protein RF55_22017, partial [Lasius niger]
MQVDHLASMVSKAPNEKKKQESLKKAPSSSEELLERKATVWERHEKLTANLLKHLVGKRNVSAETNTLAKSISESFRRMRQLDELLSAGGTAQVGQTISLRTDGTAQTSPSLYRIDSESTTRETEATEDQEEKGAPTPKSRKNRKKRKVRTPASAEAQMTKRRRQRDESMETQRRREPTGERNRDWEEVRKRKKKKPRKQRESPTLPNALMIRAKEGKSYADILRKIKLDASSKQIGESVDKVRRTNTGQLLIVLDKKSADKTELLRKLMADALKEDADVVSRVQQVDLEIRDLDETATKEEVANA